MYYHTDALGSVRMITDATGNVVTRYDYQPFGMTLQAQSAGDTNRLLFTGQERDPETSAVGWTPMDYFKAREYQSWIGRFTSPDTPGFGRPFEPQSMNMYAYAYGNPLRFVDPTGHAGDCVGGYDAKTGSCEPVLDPGTLRFFFETLFGNPFGVSQLQVNPVAPVPTVGTLDCTLQVPSGRYTLGPNAVARFQPSMVAALNSAFQSLNNQGIVPMITSGFRTASDQWRMQQGASGPNPAAAVSWHQVGLAVDLNSRVSNFGAIKSAMTAEGLTWGGTFRRSDPVHFQLPPAGTRPAAGMVTACGGR